MENLDVECGCCGHDVSAQRGQIEIWCPECDSTLNGCGQVLEYPEGRGENYAGEVYYDDY